MSNAIRCIDQRFEFKNSGISCLALIFNLESQKCGSASDESSTIFLREIDTNAWLSGEGTF